jgi:hypothetical protein
MIQLLIDGHNLIGQMPGMSLKDFDDEEQLVRRLRGYALRKRARIAVVFDSGVPGGKSQLLSGGGVEAIFAGSHTNADRILIERIHAEKRPQLWTLVSGDRAIQEEARRCRMRVQESADFAKLLSPPAAAGKSSPTDKPDQEEDVSGWIDIFKSKRGTR